MSTWTCRLGGSLLAASWAVAAGGLSIPAAWASGAAAKPSPAQDGGAEQASPRERAQAYWTARVERSRRVLDFYAPPEKGGPTRAAELSEGGNLRYTAFEIEKVDVRGDEATVRLRVAVDVPMSRRAKPPASRSARVSEKWDRMDGVWYKRPVPRGFSRGRPPRAQEE
jgi:hypothetical protein